MQIWSYSTWCKQQYTLHLIKFVHTHLSWAGFEQGPLGQQAGLLPTEPPLIDFYTHISVHNPQQPKTSNKFVTKISNRLFNFWSLFLWAYSDSWCHLNMARLNNWQVYLCGCTFVPRSIGSWKRPVLVWMNTHRRLMYANPSKLSSLSLGFGDL